MLQIRDNDFNNDWPKILKTINFETLKCFDVDVDDGDVLAQPIEKILLNK